MGAVRVNEDGTYDGPVLVFFVLIAAGRVFRWARPGLWALWSRALSQGWWQWLVAGALAIVAGAAAAWVLGDGLLGGRVRESGRWRIARAATCALAGGPVAFLACFAAAAGLAALLGRTPIAGARGAVHLVGFALAFAAAGWWTGWRFGRFGWLWGAAAALIVLGVVLPGAAARLVGSFPAVAYMGALVAASALCGHAGAMRAARRRQLSDGGDQPAIT